MRKTIILALAATLFFIWVAPNNSLAGEKASTAPTLNQGQKWRIGYYEGGPYINYPLNLRTIISELVKLGWMAPIKIPQSADESDTKNVWDYLAQNARSDYLEFAADGYWSAQWDKEERKTLKTQIINRLNYKKDIDFMIAMGTWAGIDLSNNSHQIPTMAVSVSDPVRSGMSASARRSGLDHFHARCDPARYIRQIRLFHRLTKFKKLGVVHDITPAGRTYAALDEIYMVSKERKFSVVTCEAPVRPVDGQTATEKVLQCHQELAEKVDAMFITVHRGNDKDHMQELLAPLMAHKIPTWSQRGTQEVKSGVLFSISRGGFKEVGKFHAEVMARVFNGENPGDINQIFEDPKLIVINRKIAAMIGFHIPNSILRIADKIYDSVEK